jgi:hypothetical protein
MLAIIPKSKSSNLEDTGDRLNLLALERYNITKFVDSGKMIEIQTENKVP